MTIFNNGRYEDVHKIEPISGMPGYDENREDKRRKKVTYQGRVWEEGDEDLPLHPPQTVTETPKRPIYADPRLNSRARHYFESYTTLEDKIAGLLFIETDAYYDSKKQHYIEEVLQRYKLGGLLFTKGSHKREVYLIERYQKLASLPCLMGNDLFLSLFYYFEETPWGDLDEEKFFNDLGKALHFQNKRMGINFQLAENRGGLNSFFPKCTFTEEHIKAMRKGIRDAGGIMGLFKGARSGLSQKLSSLNNYLSQENTLSEGNVNEIFSLKTLILCNLTEVQERKEAILTCLQGSSFEGFLVTEIEEEIINYIAQAIREKRLPEKEIDKRLLKILTIKSN